MLYATKNPHGGDIYGGDVILDFSANTNPFGAPQGVRDAIGATLGALDRYPDPYCRALVGAISEFEGVPREYILCGNGAAELIYAYCDALKPKRALVLAPTFAEYALSVRRVGGEVVSYPLKQENAFLLDADLLTALEDNAPDVLFLCSPNNPTGQSIPMSLLREILRVCARLGTRIFLDECFLDLADVGESAVAFLRDAPALLILKAFTKSYGMAGVRLGYCMSADASVLSRMARATQPWNVSTLAQVAGIAALGEREFLRKTRGLIVRERAWLRGELEACGFWVCPSHANFLLFRANATLGERLRERQIAIRSCANYDALDARWYRIAVRQHEENEALMRAIREVCAWQKTL